MKPDQSESNPSQPYQQGLQKNGTIFVCLFSLLDHAASLDTCL